MSNEMYIVSSPLLPRRIEGQPLSREKVESWRKRHNAGARKMEENGNSLEGIEFRVYEAERRKDLEEDPTFFGRIESLLKRNPGRLMGGALVGILGVTSWFKPEIIEVGENYLSIYPDYLFSFSYLLAEGIADLATNKPGYLVGKLLGKY